MIEVIEVLPKDEYNATLIANVRPVEWTNPEPQELYSLVVIGAGAAGLVAAAGAAALGAKVALVEKRLLGGDYLNFGCVPSKSILRSSRVVAEVRRAPEFGIKILEGAEVDFAAVMRRMRQLRTRISYGDSARHFQEMGIDVFLGEAVFNGPDSVAVDGKILRFKKALIATGSRPRAPEVEGLEQAGYLTNETVFSLTELPRRMAVIGAEGRGCEFAQAFQRLGSSVVLITAESRILREEDPDAAAVVAEALLHEQVDIRTRTTIKSVSMVAGEKVLHLDSPGRTESAVVDEILIAEGRAPNIENLKLENAGITYDLKSGVKVDDSLRTSNSNVYAAGDVCLAHKLANAAEASARLALKNALFRGRKKDRDFNVAQCVYTDPELAHVGMTEEEASRKKLQIRTFTRPLRDVSRGIIDGTEKGFVRIHVKKRSDKIVGATIVAPHAGEMIGELSVAMDGGVGLERLSRVIHPYPTQSEAIKQVGNLYNRDRLVRYRKGFRSIFVKR